MAKLLLIGPGSIHLWRYLTMIKEGFDEVKVISDRLPDSQLCGDFEVQIANFSLRNPLAFRKTIRLIRQIIRSFQPDIIHTHQAGTEALAVNLAIKKVTTPLVLTAWGSDILVVPHRNLISKRMVAYNLSQAAIITSDSLFMAQKMRELVPESHLQIRLANFGIGIQPDPSIAKENLIYSNRLHEKLYRIDRIIKEFKNFLQTQADPWNLVLAGTGSETASLRQLVKDLDIEEKVVFAGWLAPEQNAYYYNRAKLYVSIPQSDATSISLLEGMACGCIPVVADLPANHEWIIDGVNGIIVADVDSPFLSEALKLDIDLVQRVNRLQVTQKATVQANRNKFLSLYAELSELASLDD